MVEVKVKVLRSDARAPVFTREGDACADLHACGEKASTVIEPGETRVVYTGVALEIPPGFEGQVRGRSGLTSKGILVQLGTIDAAYRGRVGVLVFNSTLDPFTVQRGDRIAQLAIRPVLAVQFVQVDELSDTERGEGGFGSSGVR